ncbi:nitrate/TMAO reductase-like tetraheme cytochrome c subunit [Bacillus sp. SLBN-46]|uniref:cytochrome c3 family protein n=1 Tax=Bacillus sp. SLBN-46 TaxID=3042283 RepID=UPI00286727D8|nr:NapC/NirT family cytochrome c [Bacillus sp. SLBN-46]MDR6121603.1 nitrate/TMAO reductase-like tetraheme cytochrome c subunit [Bacillus sp. SLBN-46]
MEEEHKEELPAPPKFRYKLLKIATLTVLFLALFSSIGFFGLEATSSSEFCSSCHEMKPEYYTWKASTHSEVDCTSCHTDPVFKELAKDKAKGVIEALKKQSSSTSAAPIRMPNEIPDSACESCHNVFTREVTPSGDIIIPHDKHKNKGVECVQCHSGVVHGKVADRKMTYSTDLDKWDSKVGKAAMADFKFIRPDMDTCMECHKARKITTECTACHTTGMIPKSHKKEEFKLNTHGAQAGKDLEKCNECHKGMSEVEIQGFDELPPVIKFLHNIKDSKPKITQYEYAKQNTFCKACHSTRPASHTSHFMKDHGELASKDKQKCLACHNYQQSDELETKIVACGSCHPSMHENNKAWRKKHPVPVSVNQKVTNFCYTCHVEDTCSSCHKK